MENYRGECKIFLVEFFNSLEKIAQILSSTEHGRRLDALEDKGSIDVPVDRACTNVHKEVTVDRSIDHPEKAATADGVSRLTGMPKSNRELALCVFAKRSTALLTTIMSQSTTQSIGTRVLSFLIYSGFISNSNSDSLVSYSSRILWLYKEGYCPQLLYHIID